MSGWQSVTHQVSTEQLEQIIDLAARDLSGLPLQVVRQRRELGRRAEQAVRQVLQAFPNVNLKPNQLAAVIAQVTARVGGLGFLDAMLPPRSFEYTDVQVNGDGSVWARRKGNMIFEKCDLAPTREEMWRTVEALLAPEGRACSESTPTVDVKLPRDQALGFGGARVKVIHPIVAPGDGWPTLAVRLFEPKPVTPEQVIEWGVFPKTVIDALLEAISQRLRVLVIGGTATGKTSLLAALCHGIAFDARIVKVEDPEEIWLPHPNVTTLEARPAPPGSTVPPYTVADGVDDSLRLSPSYVIVGEVRTGDAALSLFRALMSDHAGLTTFHAEGPDQAVYRMSVIMFSDAGVRMEAAKGLFAEALDLVVQIGWRGGRRAGIGVWEIAGMAGKNVKFRQLWAPGDAEMQATSRQRR